MGVVPYSTPVYVPLQSDRRWKCEYCESANDIGSKRCSECGASVPSRNCVYIDAGDMSTGDAQGCLQGLKVGFSKVGSRIIGKVGYE